MNGKRGFTLLELIVVTAVIAILSGIVTSSILKIRENQKAQQFVSDVTELETAMKVWLVDTGNAWPENSTDFPTNLTAEFQFEASENDTADKQFKNVTAYIPRNLTTFNGEPWFYMNGGGDRFNISASAGDDNCRKGVNLVLDASQFSSDVLRKIESKIDPVDSASNANLCGRFYKDQTLDFIYYHLAPASNAIEFRN